MNLLVYVLLICLIIPVIYYQTKRFTGFWGITLFVLAFLTLFLRISILKTYPVIGFYNNETIIPSVLFAGAAAFIFSFFGYYSGHFWRRIKRLERLIFPYVFFGALEQIFFMFVFTDSVFYLSNNVLLTFLASVLYFNIIHYQKKSSIKKFFPLLAIFSVVNTYIYLIWGNILPQLLVHGLVGSLLFVEFTDTDQLKSRLG